MNHKTRVLVVEDERVVARAIQKHLEKIGYEVPFVASSGETALKKLEEIRPDLILMDIVLKGNLSGIDTAEKIRTEYNIPVVYLTAYSDSETIDKAKISEPYGYILKPFDYSKLPSTIEMALYKHRMERRLKESEAWFSTMLRSIGDGVIATDEKLRITFMNRVAERLTGWKSNDAAGKPLKKIYTILNEKTGKPVRSPVQRVLSEGIVVDSPYHTILALNDGKRITIDDRVAPIKDERGNIIGVVLIFRDITERIQLENKMRELEKFKVLGQLASGVAHEARNPLAVISTSAQFCLSQLDMSNEVKEHFQTIYRNVGNANRLVINLLNFAKPEEMNFKYQAINQILDDTIQLLNPKIREAKLKIVKQFKNDLPKIRCDAKYMQQVFINIILNAIQATPQGGVITLKSMYDLENKMIVVHIIDNGSGIPDEYINRIFDPFFTTRDRGTGLGLSVCQRIILEHGGKLLVLSKKGKRTKFTILLPTN